MRRPRIALTMGEPAGVGGETIVKALSAVSDEMDVMLAADPDWFARTAVDLGRRIETARVADAAEDVAGGLGVFPIPLAVPAVAGAPDARNAPAVIEAIRWAVDAARQGAVDAVVTAPIVKATLYEAGFHHPGHTEFIADLCGGDAPLMLLASEAVGLRVALVTIHLPLADAVATLTTERIVDAGRRLDAGLRRDFALSAPRIAVAALNPHAGEAGALGREEIDIVAPAILALQAAGIDASGPAPADSLFHGDARKTHDAALCLYHDQGLIPLKTLDFHGGVNITLGLPIVRTSPDHGAGLDIAGTGRARADSITAALRTAAAIARRRRGA